jgi:hypothetical protein
VKSSSAKVGLILGYIYKAYYLLDRPPPLHMPYIKKEKKPFVTGL